MLFPTSPPAAAAACDALSPETSGDSEQEGGHGAKMTAEEEYSHRKAKRREEFPPPITWLNPREKMPAVLKRYNTSDGRLIIREETVTHHEYFRAHRSDGRLRLELVALNDVVRDQGRDREEGGDDGEIIECGEEQENACSFIKSQPSIKFLRSRLLGVL